MCASVSILWRGDGAIVVDKDPGLLVHNSAFAGPKERTLTDIVREETGLPVVPVHRLDRGTSGVVVFAESAACAAAVADAIDTPKRYVAIVRGHVKTKHNIEHPLDDDDVPGSPRKASRSELWPIAVSATERVSLVALALYTGRRHQARRHCKHVSHPIIGDATHGKGAINRDLAARVSLRRLCLHAAAVRLSGRVVSAPMPADWREPLAQLFVTTTAAALWTAALAPQPQDDVGQNC